VNAKAAAAPKAVTALEPGFDARARLAQLEQIVELQDRILRRLARRVAELEQQGGARKLAAQIPLREAAARAGLSDRTMKRLIARGVIAGRCVRLTGSRRRWLVDSSSLWAFLTTCAAKSDG
jgi:hypothetical protein